MPEELDEPIELELTTDREIAVLMHALGLGQAKLISQSQVAGATAIYNLMVRAVGEDSEAVAESLENFGGEGVVAGEGIVSSTAAIAKLADQDERDPETIHEELEEELLGHKIL